MPISSFTLFTALTASPSDAFGARWNDKVITGNWPWWFTVMGTLVFSTRVKAASGTWPPLGNAEEDSMATVRGAAPAGPAPARLDVAADIELVGPVERAPAVPPATRPKDDPDAPAPVRINRSRRFRGLFWNSGATSRTTWYWFNCVNIVDTCRWPNASYRVWSIA